MAIHVSFFHLELECNATLIKTLVLLHSVRLPYWKMCNS